MQIKDMQLSDLPVVAALEKTIFSHPWSVESIEKAYVQPQNIYLVAVEEKKIVGYCGIWCSFETADLCNIAVSSQWRQKGIASALLKEAQSRCRQKGVEEILLEVRASNTPAIRLYRKYHFEEIAVRKNYYSAPIEDAKILRYAIMPVVS